MLHDKKKVVNLPRDSFTDITEREYLNINHLN